MDVSSQYAEFVVFGGTVFVVPGEHESEPPQYLFSTCPFAATIPPTCTADLGAAHTGTLSSLYKYVASTFAEDNGFDMWKSQIFYPAMRGAHFHAGESGRVMLRNSNYSPPAPPDLHSSGHRTAELARRATGRRW